MDLEKLKDVYEVIDEEPVLNKELIEIGQFISKKTLCNLLKLCYNVVILGSCTIDPVLSKGGKHL